MKILVKILFFNILMLCEIQFLFFFFLIKMMLQYRKNMGR